MEINIVCIAVAPVLVFSSVAVIMPTSSVSAQATWYMDDNDCPEVCMNTHCNCSTYLS